MTLAALIFVDDADLHVSNSGSDAVEELVVKAQRLLDSWHNIVKFTGGDLKLSKCYWKLQDYEWKHGKCVMISHTAHSLHVSVDGEQKEISQLSADKQDY